MTSITPTTMSLDNSHMYSFVDLRKCVKGPKKYCRGSIMDIINSNPDFSKFSFIIKLARLDDILNDIQANFTVFVPSNRMISDLPEGVLTNLDISSARQIILSSTLKYRITSELLEDSPSSYFVTMNSVEKLFITNINGITYINNCIRVVHKDIQATNGLIHVVDKLIWPYFI
jgi:uncharacterized surface protein with fasciclin (FAS1) repeats